MSSQQHTLGVLLVSRRASFSWWPCPCPCPCPWSSSPRWCATARTEQKTLPLIYGSVQKYTSDTNERTTNEIPFNRKDGISFVVRSFVRWYPPFLFFVLYYCTVLLYMCSTGPNRKLSTGRRRDRHHGQREEGSRAPRSRDQVRTQTDLLRSAAT